MFICLSVLSCAEKSKEESLPVQNVCLCVCNQGAYVDNHADAVDRHLIFLNSFMMSTLHFMLIDNIHAGQKLFESSSTTYIHGENGSIKLSIFSLITNY